jgi:hypothetical protein
VVRVDGQAVDVAPPAVERPDDRADDVAPDLGHEDMGGTVRDGLPPSGQARLVARSYNNPMKVLFLHGWRSVPGGVKPTFLKYHSHEVINPRLPDEAFAEAVRIAQAEFDKHQPQAVVGASRGGAVTMDQDTVWKLVTKHRSREATLRQFPAIRIAGDESLGLHVLDMVSVMA